MTTASDAAPESLTRNMGRLGVILLTLSDATPACSIFIYAPVLMAQAGSGALLAMAAGALVSLATAFVYAELASAFPLAGGEYAMLGRAVGPGIGFMFMAANVVGMALGTAVLALGVRAYVAAFWPGAQPVVLAVGIVAAATAVSVLNIRINAWVTGLFLLVEVLALAAIAVLGFGHMHRALAALVEHPEVLAANDLRPAPMGLVGLAIATAALSYLGFGQAVYFSEEMRDASRQVGPTILWALALTVLLEFTPMAAVFMGAPDLRRLLASSTPFSDFLRQTGGRALSLAVGVGVALAVVNAIIAGVLIAARFFYSTGRDGVWPAPANRVLVQIHPRLDAPWAATLVAGGVAGFACLLPFNLLVVITANGSVLLYGSMCLGVMLGRANGRTAHAAYRMPLYPLAPVTALIALAYVVYACWLDPAVGRPSLEINAAILILALAYYQAMRCVKGEEWRLSGPKS